MFVFCAPDDKPHYPDNLYKNLFSCNTGTYPFIQVLLYAITQHYLVPHVLQVQSRGLFDTISTLHDGREYQLLEIVQHNTFVNYSKKEMSELCDGFQVLLYLFG